MIYLDSESLLWESTLYCKQYMESEDLFGMILSIIKTMPNAPVIIVLLTMIVLTVFFYSYHRLEDNK